MTDATLEITLERRDFAPGERIRGSVEVRGAGDPAPKLRARLLWYTEGKGTQDVHTVTGTDLRGPRAGFEFPLPEAPYSFSGRLVSLIWAIEIEDVATGQARRATFELSPTRCEVVLHRALAAASEES